MSSLAVPPKVSEGAVLACKQIILMGCVGYLASTEPSVLDIGVEPEHYNDAEEDE